MFTPSRLTLARKRRGLMKNKLAELVGVTGRSISAYEAGESEPSEATVDALASTLRFPKEFFSARTPTSRFLARRAFVPSPR